MASNNWPGVMRQPQYHDRTQGLSSISHSFLSSLRSDNQSSLAEGANQEFALMHGSLRWNQSMELHCDFMSFLAICQWREIDILGITWQSALNRIGSGATAHIHQSEINPQTSFAFKRVTLSTFGSDEQSIFRALISEVLVLGHPVVRGHANIVKLMGVCWDIASNDDGAYTVWPVLVYEKAECGDLCQFMESEAGKGLSFDQRLELCIDIGTALMVMHSCSTVHGDVKHRNVLIFKNGSDRYVAKVSDFGFSALATTDECITVARTRPWNGPEWHHRGFTLSGAKKLDVYSFGMLCLWLLFKDTLYESRHSCVSVLKDWDGVDLFTQHAETFSGRIFLEELKANDQMPILTHELLTTKAGLSQELKGKLDKFFLLCLIAQSFLSLMDVDYRVRKHLFRCLKSQATSYRCEACHNSAAFQTAFCYTAGFGISSDEDQARYWLRNERTTDDLERELELVRNADWPHTESTRLMEEGYSLQVNYSGEYQRAGTLEMTEAEYVREIRDMERVLSRSHGVVRRLKTVLADVLFEMEEFERAEVLYLEVKVQLENDPEYGFEDGITLTATSNLADVLTELGKYEAAEEMLLQTLSGYEKLLGPNHPFTLLSLSKLALLSNCQGKDEHAETLCRRALEGEIITLGESHIKTLDTLNTLGMILTSQGKYEEAEEVHRREVQLTEAAVGQEHPQTMFAINNLAVISGLQGKYQVAEALSQRAIQGLERFFGKENLGTLGCMEDLARTLRDQRKFAEAEKLHRHVLAGRKSILGSTHPEVLATLDGLAVVLSAQGHHKQAEKMIKQVVVSKKELLGPDHPDTLMGISNLANFLFEQKKLKVAGKLFRQTLQKRESLLGKDNPSTLANMNDLAVVLAAQGTHAPAATLYKRALAGRGKVLGAGHPDTLTTQNNLAAVLTHLDHHAEAESFLREVLDHAAAASSRDVGEPYIATSLWNLADLLHRQKRFDEAYPLYERACTEYARGLRPEHTKCATQFADMRKEMKRRARGGVWRLDALHALLGVGEVVWEGMAAVRKSILR